MNMFNILNLNISFEAQNIVMIDVVFSVKAEVSSTQVVKIVGSLPELGGWNPLLAPSLVFKKGQWEGNKIKVQIDKKFEFKIVKVKEDKTVIWQELPNNSNRKFKPKCSVKLQLEWNIAEGKISPVTRRSVRVNGVPGGMKILLKKQSKSLKKKKSSQQFDPYENAYGDQDSNSEEDQNFTLVKRKMSDEITINSADLQQIYYNSCPIDIFWDLFNKLKLYVISSSIEVNNPFMDYVQQQLKDLPNSYFVKWITSDCLLGPDNMHSNHRRVKRKSSIFQLKEEQLHIQSLYSRTSYFMFLQIETAVNFKGKLGSVPACLFLPSSKYQQLLSVMDLLSHIQLICFDSPATNKAYCQHLTGIDNYSSGSEKQVGSKITIKNPSIQEIIEALKELKYKDTVIVNTLGNIIQKQALKLIESENIITFIDSTLAQNYPKFMKKVFEKLHHYSVVVIVTEFEPTEQILQYRDLKNVVLVYDHFQRIILDGKEYHPLRKCKETIDLLMMKLKLYQQKYGGEINQKPGTIIYYLPEEKQTIAPKIQLEFKTLASKYNFIRVSMKGTRIKIVWNLAAEARILRTICQIKYTNYGLLGNFNIISDRLTLRQLKDALRLLIEHCPKLFLAKHDTKVRYFSYGSGQAATCHILPSTSEQQISSSTQIQ